MKSLMPCVFATALLAAGASSAQQVGGAANVGPVGAGASVGGQGVGVGAHVGTLGANVGVGVQPAAYYRHRVCHGGWYWRYHRRYCRRW